MAPAALTIQTVPGPGTNQSAGDWWRYMFSVKGPSGFSSSSTAEQVSAGWKGAGKLAVITGGAAGLGYETLRVLVMRGCEVYAGVRSPAVVEESIAPIRKQFPEAKITLLPLDLSSMASVRTFAADFKKQRKGINILICNAAVMASPFELSAEGHELHFATNHLGHFLLTQLLTPELVYAAAQPGAPEGRVVVVGAWAHALWKYDEVMRWDALDSMKGYDPWKAYGQSKLCNTLFARELARRLHGQNVTTASLHPGVIFQTTLARHSSTAGQRSVFGFLFGPLLKNIAQGAATQVYLATTPTIASGGYYQESNLAASSPAAQDDAWALRLWELSEKMCAEPATA